MLEATGVGPDEERVYRLLVATLVAEPAAIADRLGSEMGAVLGILESLRAKGLVSRVAGAPPRYAATPPDVGFGPLLLRGQEALEWARREVAQLTDDYRASARRRDAAQLVEVITGAAAIRQQLANLQRSAREEIVWFCKAGHVAMPSEENTEEFEMLDKGVRYRVLYERALLEQPGMIENVAAGIRHGEVARATSTLPVRLAVADGSLALCPLVPGADGVGEPTAALVRESSLLAALLALFESYWDRASPLRLADPVSGEEPALSEAGGGPAPSVLADDEKYLLSLLVAGVADKAIATQLGLSQRTVQRRIHDLMRRANADTRMQLAWQVARLGWLDG
ncbi:helix-turn-helix domain-containing protein [Actinopolymorpha alba]|uniref:helix-turn-helix domain-containing protein n=1 Tax=Actinopolymorpha alba TaxID=533267 RepID=UPI000381D69F|nr:helix-turn-helix domain-containing protein [Actinopolymorpha alba]